MVTAKTKNPLRKRHFRELKSDFAKYLAIFLLIFLAIGEASGYLVAESSLEAAYFEGFSTYQLEDGNFTVQKRMNRAQLEKTEEQGVRLNELFFLDTSLSGGQTLRIFKNRTDMDLACVMEGRLAERPGEIAIDRLFAVNNDLKTGDVISDGIREWTITGFIALPDYSTMFESNNDLMFDSLHFGVSVVSAEEFEQLPESDLTIRYAWQYAQTPSDEQEEVRMSDAFLEALSDIVYLEEYLPRYRNQAIIFSVKDMRDTKSVMTLFIVVVIGIFAFVFAVTTSTTILKEAGSIGTLRASGYTRRELVRHYMTLPFFVTLAAVVAGNIFGYTVMNSLNAAINYNSYSLPTYTTLWSTEALLKTALIPLFIMLVVDTVVFIRKLSLSPLQFLRRELRKMKSRGAMRLNKRKAFMSRFRIRIILQNRKDYFVLFIGILAAELLLMFGLAIPDNLRHYQSTISDQMLAEYQYILTIPQGALRGQYETGKILRMLQFSKAVETENADAERFMVYTLRTPQRGSYNGENVLIYGIEPESRYVGLSFKEGETFVSSAFAEKFGLKKGDEITLSEPYGPKQYTFSVDGSYPYPGTLAVFMPREDVNKLFGFDNNMFNGYFSDTEIPDISNDYIGQVIDLDSLSKASRQLQHSMGTIANMVLVFSVLLYLILMFVLTRIIIEKNSQSISMIKILGYKDREIAGLYLASTSIAAAVSLVVALPIVRLVLNLMYNMIIATKINGWIPLYVAPWIYPVMIGIGLLSYLIVTSLEIRKIKRIPMEEALKNVE